MSKKTITAPEQEFTFTQFVHYTPVGITIDEGMTIEQWGAGVPFFEQAEERGRWCLGDYILWGEEHFTEEYAQFVHDNGDRKKTLSNIRAVCKAIPHERRRQSLTFGHHEAVAYLPAQEADRLLNDAEKKGWTRSTLREQIEVAHPKKRRHKNHNSNPPAGTNYSGSKVIEVESETTRKEGERKCENELDSQSKITANAQCADIGRSTDKNASIADTEASNASPTSNPEREAELICNVCKGEGIIESRLSEAGCDTVCHKCGGTGTTNEPEKMNILPSPCDATEQDAFAALTLLNNLLPAVHPDTMKPVLRTVWIDALKPVDALIDRFLGDKR